MLVNRTCSIGYMQIFWSHPPRQQENNSSRIHLLPVLDNGRVFKRPKTAPCNPELFQNPYMWVKGVNSGALEDFSFPCSPTPDFGVRKNKKRDLNKKCLAFKSFDDLVERLYCAQCPAKKNPTGPQRNPQTQSACLMTQCWQEEEPAMLWGQNARPPSCTPGAGPRNRKVS